MGYVDMAVGTAFFLFFLAMVLMITTQYFIRFSGIMTISEFRDAAVRLFNMFFRTKGIPKDWEETGLPPAELGMMDFLYVRPVLLKENANVTRFNEPVIANVVFDEECDNSTRNNTVRLYEANLTNLKYEYVNPVMCPGHFINETYIKFNINISRLETKILYFYYTDVEAFPYANFTSNYSNANWKPNSGDSWTESATSWSRYGGASGSAQTNDTIKISGNQSVKINGTFDNNTLGLIYDPSGFIAGLNNSWHIDAWIYLDNLSGVAAVNVSISETNDTIMTNISANALTGGKWYHFERKLNDTHWEGWGSFNASNGIDNISFYMINSSGGINRGIYVDDLHFEVEPLEVKVFPEEMRQVVSDRKIGALENLTYEDLREIIGEDYRFRIEII
jgi:hypothetical protein